MKNVLITGASGFVGVPLTQGLRDKGFVVTGIARRDVDIGISIIKADLLEYQDWPGLLSGQDCVVHLAAKAHDLAQSSGEDYYRINRDFTLAFATQ
ncbi:MAG: NAD-dependent epimerase/dehydratase family protein, partial [Gammaproteobacteria bacterium]|nr:NAD-dependent epimerase/dehydratase family protein [Gammaproteobacteria bacterium]